MEDAAPWGIGPNQGECATMPKARMTEGGSGHGDAT